MKKGNDDSDHKFLIESFMYKKGFENDFLFNNRKRILFSLIMLVEHDVPMNHKQVVMEINARYDLES